MRPLPSDSIANAARAQLSNRRAEEMALRTERDPMRAADLCGREPDDSSAPGVMRNGQVAVVAPTTEICYRNRLIRILVRVVSDSRAEGPAKIVRTVSTVSSDLML